MDINSEHHLLLARDIARSFCLAFKVLRGLHGVGGMKHEWTGEYKHQLPLCRADAESLSIDIEALNMATETKILPPNVVPAPKAAPVENGNAKRTNDSTHGLKSKWPVALDLYGSNLPCRLEGEIEDLVSSRSLSVNDRKRKTDKNQVVLGEIPKEIDGSFYRIMVDPFMPPCEGNVPLDGDGNISVFQFRDGRVHMRTRYVETERYLLERKANKSLFGLYRNPCKSISPSRL